MMSLPLSSLLVFSLFGLYQGTYYHQGRRCFDGNCAPSHDYSTPSNYRDYNRLYYKPTYTKPAYYRPVYSQPSYPHQSYQLNYPPWYRRAYSTYQQPRPVVPYEVVAINHANPETLSYYPVDANSRPYNSRIVAALEPEVEREVAGNTLEGHRPYLSTIEEEPSNEVVEPWEKVDTPYSRFSSEPPSCAKHEECVKYCQKTVNSVGVFGSCYNGSCRCGIRH